MKIQILTRLNGVGLSHDAQLIANILQARGHAVTMAEPIHRRRVTLRAIRLGQDIRRRYGAIVGHDIRPDHDINLMLEHIFPSYFETARRNLLIPNPEWVRNKWLPYLHDFDLIIAKTLHARQIFERLGYPVKWIGFTSNDRMDANVPRKRAFLHMPGKSTTKGTDNLVALWAAHPEWPALTLIWRNGPARGGEIASNITLLDKYLPEAELRKVQNEHIFHLCPSQTEGYGHYIAEALSVGAVVITTDAEPMNELVTSDRGLLVAAHAGRIQKLATLYDFDSDAMQAAVERCMNMPESEIETFQTNARDWFEQQQVEFPERLHGVLSSIDPPALHGTR